MRESHRELWRNNLCCARRVTTSRSPTHVPRAFTLFFPSHLGCRAGGLLSQRVQELGEERGRLGKNAHFCQRGGGCRGEGWCFRRSLWPDLTSAFRSRVSHLFLIIPSYFKDSAESSIDCALQPHTNTHAPVHTLHKGTHTHTHLCTRQAATRCD